MFQLNVKKEIYLAAIDKLQSSDSKLIAKFLQGILQHCLLYEDVDIKKEKTHYKVLKDNKVIFYLPLKTDKEDKTVSSPSSESNTKSNILSTNDKNILKDLGFDI